MEERTVKKLIQIESGLNWRLFLVSVVVTILTMFMLTAEFFSRGTFPSVGLIGFFYMGVLILYSLHKELLRWMHRKGGDRQGEKFVFAWIALTVFLYIANFASNCYFDFAPDGHKLETLNNITIITLEVFAVFIITRASKMKKISEIKKERAKQNG